MSDCTLIHGDAPAELRKLPGASVDLVLTDPPYPCIRRSYGTWTEAEWWELMRAVVPECMRVLKPTGSAVFILQPNSERLGRMRTWLWEFMAWVGKEYGVVQDAYWWNCTSPPNKHANRTVGLMRPSVKTAVWVGPPGCFRDQSHVLWHESERNAAMRNVRRASRYKPYGGIMDDSRCGQAAEDRGGVTPFNLLPAGQTDWTNKHPGSTPFRVCSWWVRYLTPPGGTVLDPFAGSGTVGLAALNHGANYIGIERVREYHAIARKRIEAATIPAARRTAA